MSRACALEKAIASKLDLVKIGLAQQTLTPGDVCPKPDKVPEKTLESA